MASILVTPVNTASSQIPQPTTEQSPCRSRHRFFLDLCNVLLTAVLASILASPSGSSLHSSHFMSLLCLNLSFDRRSQLIPTPQHEAWSPVPAWTGPCLSQQPCVVLFSPPLGPQSSAPRAHQPYSHTRAFVFTVSAAPIFLCFPLWFTNGSVSHFI